MLLPASGGGNFDGPASSTDNAIARFDGTTGKLVQNSSPIINDEGGLEVLAGNQVDGTKTIFRVYGGYGGSVFNLINITSDGDATFASRFGGQWLRHRASDGSVLVGDLSVNSLISAGYLSSGTYVFTPRIKYGQSVANDRDIRFDVTGIVTQINLVNTTDVGLAIDGATSQSGVMFQLRGHSSTTAGRPQADLDTVWVDNTDATRKSRVVLRVWDTAQRELICGEADGSAARLGFFSASAVNQPSGTGEATGFTAGSGTAVNDDSTFTGNVGSTAYRINDIVKALKALGLLAQ